MIRISDPKHIIFQKCKFLSALIFISYLYFFGGTCVAQQIIITGDVISYQTKKSIPATVFFEKQPDASVTVISESGEKGFRARIFYRALYKIKVSSPGYITEYEEIDLTSDSVKDQIEFVNRFTLIPIQINEVLPFRDLLFEVTSFKISPFSVPELLRLVDILVENPRVKIRLEGHTDSQGKSRKSLKLAKKRIKAIKSFLVSRQIDSGRISLKAFGGEKPVSGGMVPDLHKANRRVEIRVVDL